MTCPSGARLGTDSKVPLGELAEQDIGEVHRPDSVAALFKADVLVLERSTQEELAPPEANRPPRAHQPNHVMARVLRRRQHARILAPRWSPLAGRRLLAQGFVRPLVIVGLAKWVELALLPTRLAAGGRVVSAFNMRCIRSPRLLTAAL